MAIEGASLPWDRQKKEIGLVQASFVARSWLVLAAFLVLLMAGVGPEPAAAVGFAVNTTVDAVDAVPGDGACATAAANCSLRAAIQEANSLSGADSISVPLGDYALSVADGDGSVDLDVVTSITLNGEGAGSTVIDALALDRAFDIAQPGFVSISNVKITNGDATNSVLGNGGGVRNTGGQLLLSNVALENNAAPAGGGGVFNGGGTVTVADSTINANASANAGGGVASDGGSVNLTNVTISGNTAFDGAAVAITGGSLSASNATISGNTSSFGTVRSEGGSITLSDTIIGPNSATNCVIGTGGAYFSSGHNLSNDSTCSLTAAGDLPNTDPLIEPLADNGGPTLTHALQPLSPAIDAGNDVFCSDTDQRGVERPQGVHCDIGAFELEVTLRQGDIDCSGEVNSVDALQVLRFAAALGVAQTEPCPNPPSVVAGHPFGDVDCSGQVNSVDALKILRHNASLAVTQTEPCTDIADPL